MKYPTHLQLFLLIFFFCQSAFGQYSDQFDQGTLEQNNWTGDLQSFIINGDEQLQLTDPDPGSSNFSKIGRVLSIGDSTTWELWAFLDFSPSGSNYAEIFLALDAPSTESGNGYVLRIGGISGSDDALGLYKKTGGQYDLLAEGTVGAAGGTTVTARIRVTRNENSTWEVWADYTGGTNFTLEAEAVDDSYPTGNYFGIGCYYSATRADKFYFDDLVIGPGFADLVPPKVVSSSMNETGMITLEFSEGLEPISATNSDNYSFQPSLVFFPPEFMLGTTNELSIEVTGGLVSGTIYELELSGIEDFFGNPIADTTLYFEFLDVQIPEPYDLLINEIMADESPSVGLPDAEYIEIWNVSSKNIQLAKIIFEDGGGETQLPSRILRPQEIIVLTSSESFELLQFDNTIGVVGFPSLTNSGETISLLNEDSEV
ncbi:MAG: hypothetical protein HKN16_01905, partial [Saprospiraceae bacterium]|nr:hypothetical protein [Saprospiraceae bacterium]